MFLNISNIWSVSFWGSFHSLNLLCSLFNQDIFPGSWKKKISLIPSPKASQTCKGHTHTHTHTHLTHICDTILMTSQSSGILAVFKHLLYILVTESWFPTLSHSQPMDEYHLVLVIYCTESPKLLHTFLLRDLRISVKAVLCFAIKCVLGTGISPLSSPINTDSKYSFGCSSPSSFHLISSFS